MFELGLWSLMSNTGIPSGFIDVDLIMPGAPVPFLPSACRDKVPPSKHLYYAVHDVICTKCRGKGTGRVHPGRRHPSRSTPAFAPLGHRVGGSARSSPSLTTPYLHGGFGQRETTGLQRLLAYEPSSRYSTRPLPTSLEPPC